MHNGETALSEPTFPHTLPSRNKEALAKFVRVLSILIHPIEILIVCHYFGNDSLGMNLMAGVSGSYFRILATVGKTHIETTKAIVIYRLLSVRFSILH